MSRGKKLERIKKNRSKRRSIVWQFFRWNDKNNRKVCCDICKFETTVPLSSSTGTLLSHVRSKHSEELEYLQDIIKPMPHKKDDLGTGSTYFAKSSKRKDKLNSKKHKKNKPNNLSSNCVNTSSSAGYSSFQLASYLLPSIKKEPIENQNQNFGNRTCRNWSTISKSASRWQPKVILHDLITSNPGINHKYPTRFSRIVKQKRRFHQTIIYGTPGEVFSSGF